MTFPLAISSYCYNVLIDFVSKLSVKCVFFNLTLRVSWGSAIFYFNDNDLFTLHWILKLLCISVPVTHVPCSVEVPPCLGYTALSEPPSPGRGKPPHLSVPPLGRSALSLSFAESPPASGAASQSQPALPVLLLSPVKVSRVYEK